MLWYRYGSAVGLGISAVAARLALWPLLGDDFPLITFFLSLVAASWIGGFGPAITTLTITLIALPLVLDPRGAVALDDQINGAGAALYVVVGLGVALIGGRMRSVLAQAEAGWNAARSRQEQLEAELVERQRELREIAERRSKSLEDRLHELHEKNAFTEAILRQVPSGIVVADAKSTDVVLCNDEAQRIIRDDLLAASPLRALEKGLDPTGFRPDGSQYQAQDWPWARSLRTGEVIKNEEIQIVFADGDRRTISVNSGPALDVDDRIIAAVSAFNDVTDQRGVETAMTHSEQRFRQLADAIPQFVWIIRPDDSIEYLNQRWLDYTGLPRQERYSKDVWFSAIHPDDVASIKAARERLRDTGKSYEAEYRVRRHDGVYRWFLGRALWIRDGNGDPINRFGTATDIDDQKRAEQSARFLADVASRLASLVNEETTLNEVARLAVPFFADWCAVDLLDDQQQLRRVAVAHDEALPREAMNTASHRYRLRPDTPHGIFSVIASKRPEIVPEVTDELLIAAARNEEHLESLRAFDPKSYLCVPMVGRDRVLGAISFATARSGRRYGQDELELATDLAGRAAVALDNVRLYDQLRETDRRKDEFLATLAHELRNPLAPIRNSVLILRLKGSADPDSLWARDVIERQVGHMSRLIDDLLDVSRMTRNKLDLRLDRLELAAAVGEAVETIRPLVDGLGHELVIDLPKKPLFLEADRTRLVQVIANLLSNAAKYSEPGRTITLSVSPGESDVEIVVNDEGIGITAEQLPRIFEMFAQFTPSLERTQGGLGIGLALVQGLVELHKGSVEVHSDGLGKGSQFIVRLPLDATHTPTPDDEATGPDDASFEGKPLSRVLVVDDSEDIARSLGRVLSMNGLEVHLAYDGAKAFVMAGALRPQIAVLDIGLPGMNGYELARSIRNEPWGRSITLIAVTGWGQLNDRRRSSEAGFDHHLVKPVEPATLIQLISDQTSTNR